MGRGWLGCSSYGRANVMRRVSNIQTVFALENSCLFPLEFVKNFAFEEANKLAHLQDAIVTKAEFLNSSSRQPLA